MAAIFKPDRGLFTNGSPAPGATCTFYIEGTETMLEVYNDDAQTLSLGNIITADSQGQFDAVYLQARKYKAIVKSAGGETLYSIDTIDGSSGNGIASSGGNSAMLADTGGVDGNPEFQVSNNAISAQFKNAARAYAYVNADGTFNAAGVAFNVASVNTMTQVGRFTVVYSEQGNTSSRGVPIAMAEGENRFASLISQNNAQAIIQITDETGARVAAPFTFVLFGIDPL